MKQHNIAFSLAPLLLMILGIVTRECHAGIGAPEISLEVKSGNFAEKEKNKFYGIEPHVKWTSSGSVGEVDMEGGLDVTITENTSESIPFPPCKVWGKARTKQSFMDQDVDITARFDLQTENPNDVDLALQCVAPSTTLQLQGTTGSDPLVQKIKVMQTLKNILGRDGSTLTLIPGYNVKSSKGDMTLKYADSPSATSTYQIDVNSDNQQKLTIYNKMDENSSIAPSITNTGQLSIDYSRKLQDKGSGVLTTTYTPNECVNLKWQDGPWEANIRAPMEGYYAVNSGLKVSVKRTVDLM